jgi:hypothetical protein
MDLQIADLEGMKLTDLYKLAKKYQIPYYGQLKKKELIFAILRAQAEQSGLMFMEGVLEILPEGYGFSETDQLFAEHGGYLHFGLPDPQIRFTDRRFGFWQMPDAERERTLLRTAAGQRREWRESCRRSGTTTLPSLDSSISARKACS